MFNIKFKKNIIIIFFLFLGILGFFLEASFTNINNIKNINYNKYSNKYLKNKYEIKLLSLGENHSGTVINDSKGNDYLYMWGKNDYGQIGNGDINNNVLFPLKININKPESKIKGTIINLSLGYNNSGLVIEDNKGYDHLYMWGSNNFNQISNEFDNEKFLFPIEINKDGWGEEKIQGKITNLSLGITNSIIVIEDFQQKSHLFIWGDSNKEIVEINKDGWGEEKIQGKITNLSVGDNYIGTVLEDNVKQKTHLFMWGKNDYGQIGNGDKGGNYIDDPIEINKDGWGEEKIQGKITNLSLGNYHSGLSIEEDNGKNHLFMWGKNDYGQIGNGNKGGNNIYSPIEINKDGWGKEKIQGKITNLSLGNYHSGLSIEEENNGEENNGKNHLFMWGKNNYGQIGNGDKGGNNIYSPIEINKDGWGNWKTKGLITNLSLGWSYSGIVMKDEEGRDHLYMWGKNTFGQIGNNFINRNKNPVPIEITMDFKIKFITIDQEKKTFSITWIIKKDDANNIKLNSLTLTGTGVSENNNVNLIKEGFGENNYTIENLKVNAYDDWKINYSTNFLSESIKINDFILKDDIIFGSPHFLNENEAEISLDTSKIKERNTKIINNEITISGDGLTTQTLNLNNEDIYYKFTIPNLKENKNYNLIVSYELINDSFINGYVFKKNLFQPLNLKTPFKLSPPHLKIDYYDEKSVKLSFESQTSWGIESSKIKYFINLIDVKNNKIVKEIQTYDNIIVINNLESNKKYQFQIYAIDEINNNKSHISKLEFKTKDPLFYINYLIYGLLILMVILIVSLIFLKKFLKINKIKI